MNNMKSLTFMHFHVLKVTLMCHSAKSMCIAANTIGNRCRLTLWLPLSQSAGRPPVRSALPWKRQQAGSDSPGPAALDGASSSVGQFPPSVPLPSAAPHRTPAPDLSGSQRNHLVVILKCITLERFRFDLGLNWAAWVSFWSNTASTIVHHDTLIDKIFSYD